MLIIPVKEGENERLTNLKKITEKKKVYPKIVNLFWCERCPYNPLYF